MAHDVKNLNEMPSVGLFTRAGPAQNKSPDASSNPNRSARPRDGGIDYVGGPRSSPKKASGGGSSKCHRMLAQMKYVAAICVR